MSDRITIVAEPRSVTGKKVKQLRREGFVPGILYGQSEPLNLQMSVKELRRALRVAGTTALVTLDVDGKAYTALAREIQQHVTRGDLLHVDFMEVDMKVMITSEAELVTVGESPLVEAGEGLVTQALYSVEIECLPDDLISHIDIDISVLDTHDGTIHVRDIVPPKGVTILTDPDILVARFEFVHVEEEEEEEETLDMGILDAESVEVIARGKEDEQEALD